MNELIKPGDFLVLNKDIFLTDYFDKENNLPYKLLFLNTPQYGVLILNDKILKENDIINIEDTNNLKYIRVSNLEYTENINFKVSDFNQNSKYSSMATFTINVNEYENLPPDQIGNNTVTINNGEIKIFTVEDFTSNTTPPYDDPEGDAPYKLKILSLPSDGSKLVLDEDDLSINSEIFFTDIALGLFRCELTPNASAHSINFNFTISDVGSEQYYT